MTFSLVECVICGHRIELGANGQPDHHCDESKINRIEGGRKTTNETHPRVMNFQERISLGNFINSLNWR